MKYFAMHFSNLLFHESGEKALIIGVAGGRVGYLPQANWLYSIRFLLLVFKVELLWTTGEKND
jgi:hypothetical protein